MEKACRGRYRIVKNEDIIPGVYELCFEAPDMARAATAGQFVNVYLPGGRMLLPRPISIADARGEVITLVYQVVGEGTRELAGFKPGELIEFMGPFGTGFFDFKGSPANDARDERYSDGCNIFLIGGGVGIAPLYFAARRAREAMRGRVKLAAFLGYRDFPWYQKEFERICDKTRLVSETEGAAAYHGNIIDLLNRELRVGSIREGGARIPHDTLTCGDGPSLALACGPRPMLAAVAAWCVERNIPLRVSLEERMGCGYGACAGCTVKTKLLDDETRPQNGPAFADSTGIVKKKVCVHGPVFWENEVVW